MSHPSESSTTPPSSLAQSSPLILVSISSQPPTTSWMALLLALPLPLSLSMFSVSAVLKTSKAIYYTVGASFEGQGSGTVAVVEGETAILVCGTGLMGNPLPTISWTENKERSVCLHENAGSFHKLHM